MGENGARWKWPLWGGGVVTLALLVGAWLFLSSEPPPAAAPESPREASAPAPVGAPPVAPVGSAPAGEVPDAGLAQAPVFPPPDEAPAQYPVDLESLRARIPDNLYWKLGAPTKDEAEERRRAEDEARWNELFGKVQSGTGTEAEVRQYYAHRQQVSEDYIAFAKLVLGEYGEKLPERDRGMYELSIRMHSTRLSEIPRQIDDALARAKAQEQRRKEWLQSGRGN
ncbi:hypothetical protein P2318_09455 [Myxococcaceae bacterium GXIMD 01537]